jgi:hypothetical protein
LRQESRSAKKEVCASIPRLVDICYLYDQPFAVNLAKHFIARLLLLAKQENFVQTVIEELEAIERVMDKLEVNLFDAEELR